MVQIGDEVNFSQNVVNSLAQSLVKKTAKSHRTKRNDEPPKVLSDAFRT